VPPGETGAGNAPDANETVAPDPEPEAVEPPTVDPSTLAPSVSDVKKADAAMDPMQAVHDYEETKRA
jgi:hypothetical protein